MLKNNTTLVKKYFLASSKAQQQPDLVNRIYKDFILLPNFLSDQEHDKIVDICEKKLKRSLGRRAPYEAGHFDGVITGYRETSASTWSPKASIDQWMTTFIQQRIYSMFPDSYRWLPPHILDLAVDGSISPHVDNIQASGSIVAGLCLKSPCKMILEHQTDPSCAVEVFLDKNCFYIQRDFVRYEFKHAIVSPELSIWNGQPFKKKDRISVLFRTISQDK
ncbi:hypothetical protein DM01DRAFT_1312491 [Hesseltinella vesiculosa]|uniref:Alpha-ketoglutarate-dependent dioxygenase AlkB-like domain-containing protein n=1 Tax=Hesseltinella vesiculosa TaxID=101127 RepID=A0A1X2G498_9FUNG|nr:hypothetical protein DM01DRAFT_1312491 [Hesseltinella vesiculosa]